MNIDRLFESPESGIRNTTSRPNMKRYINLFTSKNQFLFHESKSFSHIIQYPKNYLPSGLGSTAIMKIALSFIKPLITLTCSNSLINIVTNKYHFGFLVRGA